MSLYIQLTNFWNTTCLEKKCRTIQAFNEFICRSIIRHEE